MNKKIIAVATTIATVSLVGVTSAFANTSTNTNVETPNNTTVSSTSVKDFGGKGREMGAKMEKNLTAEEKTALATMTAEQKKEFFEKKRAEVKAKRAAQEAVIDKLLAGTMLTSDEEKIRQEIIAERKERAEKKATMKDALGTRNKNANISAPSQNLNNTTDASISQ